MKGFTRILAFVLLGIYSGVVFHNIIPHIHCESDAASSDHEVAHQHDHQKDHHHGHDHHESDTDVDWIDLFLNLLGEKGHSDLGDCHFENFTAKADNLSFSGTALEQDDVDVYFNVNPYQGFTADTEYNPVTYTKILYEQFFHCSPPLRGPPSIA
ncbi:MAG: hypothetical protein QNK23_01205 [Crocinitomicaceae bacterium]|nr:hypothetical protein [Crocinitomicaceae bacterium]